jgi:hypothetical protein
MRLARIHIEITVSNVAPYLTIKVTPPAEPGNGTGYFRTNAALPIGSIFLSLRCLQAHCWGVSGRVHANALPLHHPYGAHR